MRAELRAEWTKFRTVRGWVLGLVVAAAVVVGVGMLGPAGSTFSCSGPDGQPCDSTPATGPDGTAVVDRFTFVHQPLTGDGAITARVASLRGNDRLEPWAKAGVIIKESTTEGSAYAAMMVTGGHGVRMQHDYTQDKAGTNATWLRLTRVGDRITGAESTDGAQWTDIDTVALVGLPETVRIGLFTTSPDHVVTTQTLGGSSGSGEPASATARFENVSLDGPWTGGEPDGTGFTVTGSGDIAPITAGRRSRAKTIENGLVGAFAGLIALIVVGATFMTAEYRRDLIRTTLAASPRRGRVLAAKAVVIGSVTFVTGLVAAVVAVRVVEGVERAKGFYVFPVPLMTEVRIVVGTAALLALAAVLALAVGAVLRRSAGAVTVVIVAIVLPYLLAVAAVLPAGASEWLLRVTPAAGFAIQQSMPEYAQVDAGYTPADGYFPLTPWAGFAVLCGYTAVALGLAFSLLRRRDA